MPMFELTMVFFLLTLGIYILTFVVKRVEMQWLGFFVAICSMCLTLTEETLDQNESIILVVLAFFIMLMTGRKAFMNRY